MPHQGLIAARQTETPLARAQSHGQWQHAGVGRLTIPWADDQDRYQAPKWPTPRRPWHQSQALPCQMFSGQSQHSRQHSYVDIAHRIGTPSIAHAQTGPGRLHPHHRDKSCRSWYPPDRQSSAIRWIYRILTAQRKRPFHHQEFPSQCRG